LAESSEIGTETILQVKSLRKFFTVKKGFFNPIEHTLRAVDGVSFEVQTGEALGLVGESGCGKSTVGRSVLRLLEPEAGEVYFHGEDVLKADRKRMLALRRKMQIVFQDPYSSLNPRRSVMQTLAEPLHVHKLGDPKTIKSRVLDTLEEVGLSPEAAGKYPHEFSGGQRQRLGIARALLFQPELIVADEPVSALDMSIRSAILLLLRDLQKKRGLSFIFISHDLGVVRYFCRRLAVMYLGRIVEEGPVGEVFDAPKHPYTQVLRLASPIPDPTARQILPRLEGEVPSPLNPPSGCHFHPRCSQVMDRCRLEYPGLKSLGPRHRVACHLYN